MDAHVFSLAHGVIVLEQLSPEYGGERRRLNVRKVRASKYRSGYHDFVIEKGGVTVFPRLVASEHPADFIEENFSSGVPSIDELLGGGLPRGTSTLFSGPPGTGKSTLALKFAIAAAHRGEKVVLYTFDESLSVLHARAAGLNLGFDKLVASGMISAVQIVPPRFPRASWRRGCSVASKKA